MSTEIREIYLRILKRQVPVSRVEQIGNFYQVIWDMDHIKLGERWSSFLGTNNMTWYEINRLCAVFLCAADPT